MMPPAWNYLLYCCVVTGFCCCLRSGATTSGGKPDVPAIAYYFTTKGRYEEVNPHLREDIYSVNFSALQPPPKQCRQAHLTAFIRHGTRYPCRKNIVKMQEFYELAKTSAWSQESWLRELRDRVRMWDTEKLNGNLAPKGELDHKAEAVRYSKLFPSLLSKEKFQSGHVNFITSSKRRCINTTLAFQAGLAKLWGISAQEFHYSENDTLMRFYDECPRFIKDVEESPASSAEAVKFKQGPEMRGVLERVADRLGKPYNNITFDTVVSAYYFCGYELTIKTLNSPWCKLLDKADAQVIEYTSDLKQYWKRGYGFDINSKASCNLFHHIFNRLETAASEIRAGREVTEAASFLIGHAETLTPLLTLFGFFNDGVPLTASNYAEQQNRTFRTSRMNPYVSNLALVLYDCGSDDGPRLQVLFNEKHIDFPGLSSHQASIPLLDEVMEKYRDLLDGCDFEEECKLSSADPGRV